jgi:hypothetical protein
MVPLKNIFIVGLIKSQKFTLFVSPSYYYYYYYYYYLIIKNL